ncbi:hypothetical protein B0I72DRAFT_142553 [Yarrowia lipolytica]|jgi:hypothetical protein|uniref:Secreted protein n=1 Tax=Yarrowia lipolytica TaxID=4952 RepID=A0A371C173_YARLL|nr:hypothetical protein BKA91DRAFT_133136 [Yarrowia lipolytica]KAE8175426.1 hypothetical protein BKA90DRAFT_132634 [Yarrowia lipolytica]RDW24089.1 hypothetical protein B0I71DRAFT_134862 [Yarrowia lipolytica]RDW29836.1 hypothetical protein B0I72DRAFT_142553 [Yarrowia lipolytica]RDW42435.1 hypothetical protein B0I73DRAFT_127061 [Yarrowia lipolytica]
MIFLVAFVAFVAFVTCGMCGMCDICGLIINICIDVSRRSLFFCGEAVFLSHVSLHKWYYAHTCTRVLLYVLYSHLEELVPRFPRVKYRLSPTTVVWVSVWSRANCLCLACQFMHLPP